MKSIQLHTDGSCPKGNPGRGGWAYIIVDSDVPGETAMYGGFKKTTNNRMEIMAVLKGLESLSEPSSVEVYSDSEYVVKSINTWLDSWIKKGRVMKNMDLWMLISRLKKKHSVHANWVKGHNGDYYNEQCDELAYYGATQTDLSQDAGYIASLIVAEKSTPKRKSFKHNFRMR